MMVAMQTGLLGTGLLLVAAGTCGTPGDITFVLAMFFVLQGYLRECRSGHPQPAARRQRHGRTGAAATRLALGHRGQAGRRDINIGKGEIVSSITSLSSMVRIRPACMRFLGAHCAGRTRGAGRAFRLGQDDLRQAHPAALRRQVGRDPIDGQNIADVKQSEPARPDRHRAAGAHPVPPHPGRKHRLCPSRRLARRDRAGGPAGQRP
jgi:hypothetical protein